MPVDVSVEIGRTMAIGVMVAITVGFATALITYVLADVSEPWAGILPVATALIAAAAAARWAMRSS